MSHLRFTAGATEPVRFVVVADSFPGLLVRLLEPLARRDIVPDAVSAERQDETMTVEIACHAMPVACVHLIEGNLRQVVGVHTVTRAARPVAIAA